MPFPAFDSRGDLPEGVYRATLAEVIAHFGHGTPPRELVTTKLVHIYELARLETVDEFIAYWQRTRDLSRRGIVEVTL